MRALITGISGQDGRYLARHLTATGYEVFGISRSLPTERTFLDGVTLFDRDLRSDDDVVDVVRSVKPDEVYHLAAQSSPARSWSEPGITTDIQCSGTVSLLEAVRIHCADAKVFFASSSEVFGSSSTPPLDESTPHRAMSPYGASKVFAHQLCEAYRGRYGLFIAVGILFNHESPLRPPAFVSRKITAAAAAIKRGLQSELTLGGLDMVRDWGHAGDYVLAMHRMLSAGVPETYVIATGEPHTVGDWCRIAFDEVGLDYREFVRIDPAFAHGPVSSHVIGNAGKIQRDLGWKPSTTFDELVREMVRVDLTSST